MIPFFLAALTQRDKEDGKVTFDNELKVNLHANITIMLIALIIISVIEVLFKDWTETMLILIGSITVMIVVYIAIWCVQGGPGRLIKRLIKRLSKIKLPTIRLKLPIPVPIPQT